MSYKLLALDVDGTLVRPDGSIHPEDRAAIDRVRAAGVVVTIVTGRMYSGTQPVAQSLELSGPVACLDGSHIVDLADSSPLFCSSMRGVAASAVREALTQRATASFLLAHDGIVHDLSGQPFAAYVTTWSPNLTQVDRVIEHPYWEHDLGVMAVLVIGSDHDISETALALDAFGHGLRVATFDLPSLDRSAMLVRAGGSTKGTAVEWLAGHYGCLSSETVAVGDWLNDVPMFQVAGRSFAMAQAPDALKECATDRLEADGLVGGGIAEAIRAIWGC